MVAISAHNQGGFAASKIVFAISFISAIIGIILLIIYNYKKKKAAEAEAKRKAAEEAEAKRQRERDEERKRREAALAEQRKKQEEERRNAENEERKRRQRIEEERKKQNESSHSNPGLKRQVDTAISLFEQNNIPALQQKLFEIYSTMNKPGGGRQIVEYDRKDQLCEIFTMCLMYDWMHDSDIREVWAENGFYCIASFIQIEKGNIMDILAGALDLFHLIEIGGDSLLPKFNDILQKAAFKVNMGFGGIESQIFDPKAFSQGARFVLRQFSFFAATWLSMAEEMHPGIISGKDRPAYERAKNDSECAAIPVEKIVAKMKFFATIIESILLDM